MTTSIEAHVGLSVILTVSLRLCWCQSSSFLLYIDPISPVYEGERLIVTCNFFLLIKQKSNLKWILNGTIVDTTYMYTDINFQLVRAEKKGYMTIHNITINLNNTKVACAASFPDNGEEMISNASTIHVEGLPVAVENLKMDVLKNLFFVTWKAPFTFFRQSITYCVEIVTQVSRHSLVAECGLTIPSVTYDNVDYLTLYEAIVIPRNKIGNGTSSSVFPSLSGIINNCYTTVRDGTYSVQVQCHFNDTVIGGILILLLHNDPNESDKRGKIMGKNVVTKPDASVTVNGRVHGSFYVTIHPVLKKSGILGSRIPFGQRIYIPELKMSMLDISTTTILSTTGTMSIAHQSTTEGITSQTTYPVKTAAVTTYSSTFTATTASLIMGVGSFTLGLIPGLILGALCGYKLFNKKMHSLPEPQELASSPNVALLTYPDHDQPPPKLPPLSVDYSKLPTTTLPPIHQPLPPINTDNKATSILPPLIDGPKPVQLPSRLPPLDANLSTLHSSNWTNTSNLPSLSYHGTISSVKHKKRSHSSRHQKNAVFPLEYTDELHPKNVEQILKKKLTNVKKKTDVEKYMQKSGDMHSFNNDVIQEVSDREENSQVQSANGGHSVPYGNSENFIMKRKTKLEENISTAMKNGYEHPDKCDGIQSNQEKAQSTSKLDQDNMSTKDNKSLTASCKLEKITASQSRSQEIITSQTATSIYSFSDQELKVEVPLTDTIWPQTLD